MFLRLSLVIFSLCLGSSLQASSTNNRYVAASFGKFNWFQANRICHHSNMILATVSSYDRHLEVIRSIVRNGHLLGVEKFWLGGTNLANLSSWNWLDIGTPFGYKNWAKDEPQSDLTGEEACLVMGLDEAWYSEDCQSEYFFICESSCENSNSLEPLYIVTDLPN